MPSPPAPDSEGHALAIFLHSFRYLPLLLPPEGSAGYVEPAAGAFESQQDYLSQLESQMRSLGISTLFQQTFVGETSEAKSMDRSDSDSLLAIVSADLQNALQEFYL